MCSSSKIIYDICVLYFMYIYIYLLGGGFKHACLPSHPLLGVGRCPNYLTHACFKTNHFQNQRLLNAM